MTSPDYVSSISLLPTVDFLEYIAKKQWGSEASYGVGFSPIIPEFYSTTNSEWLCLNSESEFLTSPLGTAAIKNPFSYTRPESSPVFVALNDLRVKPTQIKNAKSLFLFRIGDNGNEVISVSNYDKNSDNTTTAPPLDCFSRECLSWFSSDNDWFTGFGYSSQTLISLIVNNEGVITVKSDDILRGIIDNSTTEIPHTNIQILGSVSTLSPWVSIQLSTGVSLINTEDKANILFLYSVDKNNDSLVSFAYGYTSPVGQGINYDKIVTQVSFNSEIIII
ncbi:hypothetical protein [Planktothrix sp.]|uniref:hypothetical protein n=2 Tax=Planktothrix sp. TaxID=3088171 RepID=UPI0038D41A05